MLILILVFQILSYDSWNRESKGVRIECGALMKKNGILELKTRREIYQFILKYPGLNKSELSRMLNIPYTTLKYQKRNIRLRVREFQIKQKGLNLYMHIFSGFSYIPQTYFNSLKFLRVNWYNYEGTIINE